MTREAHARVRRLGVALLLALAAWAAAASTARAFDVTTFTGSVTDPSGERLVQAGAHPDLTTTIEFATTTRRDGVPVADGNVKNVFVDLPPGLVGSPAGVARCSEQELTGPDPGTSPVCGTLTQVGTVTVRFAYAGSMFDVPFPLFNVDPPRGTAARFGFNIFGVLVLVDAKLRADGTYTIGADAVNISQGIPISAIRLVLWGVPGDPSHDAERVCENIVGGPSGRCPSSTRRAFISNPTNCAAGPRPTSLRTDSWQQPGAFLTRSFTSDSFGEPLAFTACDELRFDPRIDVHATSARADSPTGLNVAIDVPQTAGAGAPATAHMRRAVVELPEGMTVAPPSADGLDACSPQQIGLGTSSAPTCPERSRIGSLRIVTPLLDEELAGDVYLARQKENPFGTLLALYLVARNDERGVMLKLPGRIDLDQATGRLLATFEELPELPFSRLELRLDGGSRASLATPPRCGTFTTRAQFTSWASDAPVAGESTLRIDEGCEVGGFAPRFAAGVANPSAGASSPFSLVVARRDGEQTLRTVAARLPPGLLGMVSQVPLCGEAQAVAGTCDAGSRIGRVEVAAGAGPDPLWLPQAGRAATAVHLAGPYKGAPFSLSFVVPAQAGPLDLGTVVVRAPLRIDPVDAHVSVESDPLPHILQGIPLRMRELRVLIDREGFMRNPTSCEEGSVAGSIGSLEGAVAQVASRFQASDCRALKFAPRLTLRVGARGRTRPGRTTPLVARLTLPAGHANAGVVDVTLPDTLNTRLHVVNRACTLSEYRAGAAKCVAVGTASAVTPLLREPLRGNAYFVENPARKLPDLKVALRGQVPIDLTGKVSVTRDLALRTQFDTVPDAPISSFTLRLRAGANGAIGVVTGLCSSRGRAATASVQIVAQSGRSVRHSPRPAVAGCAKGGARARGRARGRTPKRAGKRGRAGR